MQLLPGRALKTARGQVEYSEYGDGPAVISLHGAMGGHDQSELLARTIGPQGCRHLAISRPGYLGTPLSSGPTAEAQADLCAALLDALGIDRAIVMAVSGGGPCAIEFGIRHPDRCRGLVLVSTCAGRMDTPIPWMFTVMTLLARSTFFVGRMRDKVARDPHATARRSIRDPDLCARTLSHPDAGPLLTALQLSTFDRMAQRIAGTKRDIEITRSREFALETITAPTLVVHGTADQVVPYEPHAEALHARITGAELFAIQAGEHVSIFTHLEEVRQRVNLFFSALGNGG